MRRRGAGRRLSSCHTTPRSVCACIISVQVMSRLCGNGRRCTCALSAGEVSEGAVPVIRGVVSSGRGGHQGQCLCVCFSPQRV